MKLMKRCLLTVLLLALLAAPAAAQVTSAAVCLPESDTLAVSCTGLEPLKEYALIVLESSGTAVPALSSTNLVLIDQLSSTNAGELSVAFVCGGLPECTVLLGGEFGEETSPIVIGRYDPDADSVLRTPAALSAVEDEAFAGSRFNYVYIGDRVTSIGAGAFKGCTALEAVVIPESVTNIAADAFSGCGDVVIVCQPGSAAEEFAAENGLRCHLQ